MGISADIYTHERASFRERIAALAGGTTWREPCGGRSTDPDRMTDQDVAAALAYARRGPADIGPDVAYCIVCQSNTNRERIVRELAAALVESGGYYLRKARPYVTSIAMQAFDSAVWQARCARPEGCGEKAYSALLIAGVATLHSLADTAISDAGRAFRSKCA